MQWATMGGDPDSGRPGAFPGLGAGALLGASGPFVSTTIEPSTGWNGVAARLAARDAWRSASIRSISLSSEEASSLTGPPGGSGAADGVAGGLGVAGGGSR